MKKSKYSYPAIFFIIAVIAAIFYYYMNKKEVFQIIPLDVVDHIDSTIHEGGSRPFARDDHYIVIGYESHEKNIGKIDSFVCSKLGETDSIIKKYANYGMIFLKKSDITNNEHLKVQDRDFVRHSMRFDYLCTYTWSYSEWV